MESDSINRRRIAAEIAAIVFGILIAFWIDAAWEGRQEARAEQEILASLESDLQASLDGLQSHWLPMHGGALVATFEVLQRALNLPASRVDLSSMMSAVSDTLRVSTDVSVGLANLVTAAAGRRRADRITVSDSLIGAALVTATYDPTLASLNTLFAVGGLTRIRDHQLRAALSALPGQLADAQDEELAARDHVDRRLRPLLEAAGDMAIVNMIHWNWLESWAPPATTDLTFELSNEVVGALALRQAQQTAVVAELALLSSALERTLALIRAQRR